MMKVTQKDMLEDNWYLSNKHKSWIDFFYIWMFMYTIIQGQDGDWYE